jgi:RNA polymerase sigma factor for flagellar operon FliA
MLDQRQRDQLIEDHLDYVRSLAGQLKRQHSLDHDLEELTAQGTKGLVEAAQRFDPSRGVSFTTFAYYRIRGAMFDGLRRAGWIKRIEFSRFSAAAHDYLDNLGQRAVEPLHRARGRGALVQELGSALDDLATIFITSLCGADVEELPDGQTPDAIQALESREARSAVSQAVARLPEKERQLIELYYYQGLTLEDAGARLGISKSWCSRLHAKAVRGLAEALGHLGG